MTIDEANLYKQLRPYKILVQKTKDFIANALSNISKPYVACSFGKDSAVMLHLILQQNPTIPVRFIRWTGETEIINNFEHVIQQWYKLHPELNLNQIVMSRMTVDDRVSERYITTEYDSFFVGIRAEESVDRRITLKAHGTIYKMKSGLTRISPLAWWKTNDIAAYCFSNNLPMLSSYKQEGVFSRTTSRVPRADHGIRTQFLSNLRQRDLEAYNKLLQNFPELSTNG